MSEEKQVRIAWKHSTIFLLVVVAVLLIIIWNQGIHIRTLEDINYKQCSLTNNLIDTVNSAADVIEEVYGEEIDTMPHMDCTAFTW